MQKLSSDRLVAAASGGAAVLFGQKVSDDVHALGIYRATCVGPRGQDMERYARVRDALADLSARGVVSRYWNRKMIERLEDEMNDIELEDKWGGVQVAPNTVMTLGKNFILDRALAGSGYTVVGPYMGLISSVSYSSINAADTMAQLAGTNNWREAGATNAPTYTSPRKTMAWSSASGGSKSLSSALSFAITSSGTLKGAFMTSDTGAVSTIDSTAGTLISAGLFTGGDQPVANTNTVSVTYSLSL